jgi:glycosyltransferase involved in cell wall biosynthesis
MACGLPAIVSNCASLPELVIPGETGFTFDSVADLEDLLVKARDGAHDLPAMSSAAREHVASNYSYEEVGNRFLSFYSEILGRPL